MKEVYSPPIVGRQDELSTDPDSENRYGYQMLNACSVRLYSRFLLLYRSCFLPSKTMNSPKFVSDDSKPRHTSCSHTSSQPGDPGLRRTDTSLSGLAARNHRAVVRWWIFCCVCFLIFTPLVSVFLGLHLHARDFQYIDKSSFTGRTVRQ